MDRKKWLKKKTRFPPGKNFMWLPKSEEAVERIKEMLYSGDVEMKNLGIKLFYEVCKIWDSDSSVYIDERIMIAKARLALVQKRMRRRTRKRYEK